MTDKILQQAVDASEHPFNDESYRGFVSHVKQRSTSKKERRKHAVEAIMKMRQNVKSDSPEEQTNSGLLSTDLFAGFDPDECELLVMDGYDDCIVGVVERCGQDPIVCYDKEKVLLRLESDGMDRSEAEEFFYFNQIGAWMGDSTPCFLSSNSPVNSQAERS